MLFAQICAPFADAQSAEVGPISAKSNLRIISSVCDRAHLAPPDFRLLPKTTTRGPGLNLDLSCPPSRQHFLQIAPHWKEIQGASGAPMFCGIVYDSDVPIQACTKG
jgi:hypothetical protein